MKSQSYKLRSELNDGLMKYGEDNNLSPISIIEELVEDFLCRNDYLCAEIEIAPSKVEKIKHASYLRGAYQIRKQIGDKRKTYGSSKSPEIVKEIINFLESVNWDVKYTTTSTGLTGEDQINFLLNEIERSSEI